MGEEQIRGDRPDRRSPSPADSPRGRSHAGRAPDRPPLDRHLAAAHRYLIQVLVDRDRADALFRRFADDLRRHPDPTDDPARIALRAGLIRLLADDRRGGPPSMPLPPIDESAERARFDLIWRTLILERTWDRLEALQDRTGQPLHLALRQRAEAPGLSFAELADRIARNLGRPVSVDAARQLLRRAGSEFSRILLDEVVAGLPPGSPFEAIERELIETNLLAFCREAISALRASARSAPLRRAARRPSR